MRKTKELAALLSLVISIWIFLVLIAWPASDKVTNGFSSYLVAARLVLAGRPSDYLYNDAAFRLEVESETMHQASDIFWANPPTTALMFLPIAPLANLTARRVWIGFSVMALAAAILLANLVLRPGGFPGVAAYLSAAVLLVSAPVSQSFRDGQAYVLVLLVMCVALFGLYRGADWIVGLCLALAILLKASGLPIWILLALNGRWRLIVWGFSSLIVLGMASLLLTGTQVWQTFIFQVAPRLLSSPVIAVPAYQTVPGFFRHLFVYDPVWNPRPLADWPFIGSVATLLMELSLFALAGFYVRHSSSESAFCLGLLLSVILIPPAEQYQYLLLFPAFLLALRAPSVPLLPLLIASALITVPIAYTAPAFSQGAWALLAYPRLYGALILFGCVQLYSGGKSADADLRA